MTFHSFIHLNYQHTSSHILYGLSLLWSKGVTYWEQWLTFWLFQIQNVVYKPTNVIFSTDETTKFAMKIPG